MRSTLILRTRGGEASPLEEQKSLQQEFLHGGARASAAVSSARAREERERKGSEETLELKEGRVGNNDRS